MKMLRLRDVIDKTGLSRSSIYRYISLNKFPKPVHLGENTVAWVEHEIDDWLMARLNERDLDEK